ncbi:MAG TPA: hypothetical protein VHC40_14200, partial [Rhizomicrobium sp.]|nr:hypothetical protein [Rhizomicrobium sp.]
PYIAVIPRIVTSCSALRAGPASSVVRRREHPATICRQQFVRAGLIPNLSKDEPAIQVMDFR